MKRSAAAITLDFFAMDLLVPLKRTAREKAFILVIAGRITNMKRCNPPRSTAASTAADGF